MQRGSLRSEQNWTPKLEGGGRGEGGGERGRVRGEGRSLHKNGSNAVSEKTWAVYTVLAAQFSENLC